MVKRANESINITQEEKTNILKYENISFGKYYLGAGCGEKDVDGRKEYCLRLLNLIQPIAKECRLYNPKFSEECYFGQGLIVKELFEKNGKYYTLNLKRDIWTNLENFWIGYDWHVSIPRFHAQGDVYFIIDIKSVNWILFFKEFPSFRALKNLSKVLKSELGFKQTTEIINDNNELVIIEFFTGTIRANIESLKHLEKIMYLSDE